MATPNVADVMMISRRMSRLRLLSSSMLMYSSVSLMYSPGARPRAPQARRYPVPWRHIPHIPYPGPNTVRTRPRFALPLGPAGARRTVRRSQTKGAPHRRKLLWGASGSPNTDASPCAPSQPPAAGHGAQIKRSFYCFHAVSLGIRLFAMTMAERARLWTRGGRRMRRSA